MKKNLLLIIFSWSCLCLTAQVQKNETLPLTQDGKFVLGCNYWASHAGTNMWNDWRPDVIDEDLKQISEAGLQVIRVFPIWPDFQPIYQYYGAKGNLQEIRFKDGPLPGTGPGKDGVSVVQLDHFRQFADLAEKHNIKLIVGLVTGWMSGQLFIPPALEGRRILSDPVSIMWQVKFVRNMVHEFKNHSAIAAWDLGNECNVMESMENSEAAYVWTASIVNAIKAEDQSRPVVSGMHSLSCGSNATWRIQDQAELTDLLTTHPYPFWSPHTNQDPSNTIRTIMHSAAETRFYGDVGGKPCLVEEIGIMGLMEANEQTKTEFLRSILFNNWANNCHGVLWWCAYDQNQLDFTPYEWYAVERDLGLFKTDRSPKPVVGELQKFRKFIDGLPFDSLPPHKKEAVCILTDGQDQWGAAYSTYILAKQAGFDIEFQYGNQPLKEAPLYIMPSIKGLTLINRKEWLSILDKVKNGATLYVSFDLGFLSPFVEPAGIDIVSSQNRTEAAGFISNDGSIKTFSMGASRKLKVKPSTATVLAHEKDGNPIFTVNDYGKGKIYFLGFPMEMNLTNTPSGFTENAPECWKVYQRIADELIEKNRLVRKNDPYIGITEHKLADGSMVIVLVNYSPEDKNVELTIKNGWKIKKAIYGKASEDSKVSIPANDAFVLFLSQE
ncbi:cellulase family glycosylhydrolase [Draconibacterium sp. IB214405]|uniref:glycoside hydrolase family 2 TIM barrel-domain containing protein n=1 Tax=Draconibacterium sp. IB214405 TaxID=3097352 RepID=UPI002A1764AA|nr:glycoside hydrolase family 2 TIM barrel-domain containing protein [Draconibacterium sp. IB214405]MDX8339642.1 cellulase family glycosylhydrolase [Draconibacterium sp. IB214405]